MKSHAVRQLLVALTFTLFAVGSFAASEFSEVAGNDLMTGKPVKVEAAGAKGLVVTFLSAKCPCSNSHVVELNELSKQYPQLHFVGVRANADETKAEAEEYFKKMKLAFPIIEDSEATIANRFKALKTPHAYLVAADGSFAYRGGVSNSKDCQKADRKYLREAIEDYAAGPPVRTPESRTLGCAIKRG